MGTAWPCLLAAGPRRRLPAAAPPRREQPVRPTGPMRSGQQRGNGHCYMESFFFVFSNPPGGNDPPAVPSGAAQGHTTAAASGHAAGARRFRVKLSLNAEGPAQPRRNAAQAWMGLLKLSLRR